MHKELRFGIITIQRLPWQEEVKRWKSIEALKFDSIWLADHFLDPFNPTDNWYEAWTLLAALTPFTERIRVGTLVTSIPLRHPAILARQALTVDHISNGRLELGIGSGVSGKTDPVYEMIGIDDWQPPERVERFKEQLEIIDKLLRNRKISYEGKYYSLKNVYMYPPPIQKPRPPITIAAMGKSMLKIAAQYADTWNSLGGEWNTPVKDMLKNTIERNEALDQYCDKIGRNPQSIDRSFLFFGADFASIFESEENFRNIVGWYKDIGINEFIFYYPYEPNQLSKFEQIAKEAIPKVKKGK
jgi:alkanesulfonate monooxygenase SsuD/methylene tetrahydromethanopterin reductase-like flavin-dependent oxidoreductase (luciferase family)